MRINAAGMGAIVVFLACCLGVGYALGSHLGAAEWRAIGAALIAIAAGVAVFVLAYRE